MWTIPGLVQLQDLLQSTISPRSHGLRLRQLPAGGMSDLRALLAEIRDFADGKHVVIQADLATTREFFKQAGLMGMMSEVYHYITTDLVRIFVTRRHLRP